MSNTPGSGVGGGKPSEASATIPVSSEAQERLLQGEQSYARMQQELQTLVQWRDSTPTQSGRTGSQIVRMQQALQQKEAELDMMRAVVRRQGVTIRTQSEAIANPKRHYVTPARFGDNNPDGMMLGQGSGQPMPPPPRPSFSAGTPGTPGNFPFPQQQQQQQTPTAALLPSAHDRWQQPSSTQSPFDANRNQTWEQQLTYHPQGPQMQQFSRGYHTTPTGASYGSHSTPFPTYGSSRDTFDSQPWAQQPHNPAFMEGDAVGAQLAKVWRMAVSFARSHVNTPSTARDNAMPQRIKDILLNAATRTTAFQFMSTPLCRYFLVAKVIVQWLMKNVLKVDSFTGFDSNVDRVIESCRNQIYQSTPAQVKYQLLTTVVQQMATLKQNPRFESFLLQLSRTRANQLWLELQTMMHQKSSRDWDDLLSLVTEAHRLALLMYSGADEYRYEMPQYGQPFRRDGMESKDPQHNMHEPEDLEAMGATVRLAFTPHVGVRTSLPNGHVTSRTLLRAYVLVKVGR